MMLDEQEFERRVRERTAHLEAANRELEAFVSSVSHDLRSPLRSILGFSRIVIEEHGGELSADAVVCMDRLSASAAQMSGMLEGLLRLACTGQKELVKSTVDVGSLARRIIQRLRREEPERQVECVIQEPLIAVGDEALLEIALENLLGNAWKYTRNVPTARIEIGGTPREGRSLYFVRDTGAGFDESQAHLLFKPFQRLHRQEEFPGVGIGLATVARIIAMHGGRIWAKGQVGAGATFSFTL
jgi:light-regulated signal transduction histidine kinase (bacteriophytochrome)